MASDFSVFEFFITDSKSRVRVDHFMASRLPQFSRSQLKRVIEEGYVQCNEERVKKPGLLLRQGDHLRIEIPAPQPLEIEPKRLKLAIVHEDDDLIVVNKPVGLVIHPGAGREAETLVHGLLAHSPLSSVGGKLRPGIVHRLDKNTSGLMVIAKHDLAHRVLSGAIERHEVVKEYLAICYGVPHPPSGTFRTLYGRNPASRVKFSSKVKRGKEAITHYEVIRSWGTISFVRLRLETGRTHQIRVHLSDRGWPIVGDILYGKIRKLKWMDNYPGLWPLIECFPGHALHSYRLSFQHPTLQKWVSYEADPPEEFAQIEKVLSR